MFALMMFGVRKKKYLAWQTLLVMAPPDLCFQNLYYGFIDDYLEHHISKNQLRRSWNGPSKTRAKWLILPCSEGRTRIGNAIGDGTSGHLFLNYFTSTCMASLGTAYLKTAQSELKRTLTIPSKVIALSLLRSANQNRKCYPNRNRWTFDFKTGLGGRRHMWAQHIWKPAKPELKRIIKNASEVTAYFLFFCSFLSSVFSLARKHLSSLLFFSVFLSPCYLLLLLAEMHLRASSSILFLRTECSRR